MSDESSFEIINKKADVENMENGKDTLNSNNWLTNIPPPTELPSFLPISSTSKTSVGRNNNNNGAGAGAGSSSSSGNNNATKKETMFHPTPFNPVIPESKDTSNTNENFDSSEQSSSVIEERIYGAGGLFDWVKDTVGTKGGSIFTKVAEKAKNSVETVITALDPQMKDYISNGTDGLQVIVTSEKEVEVSAIREGVYTVFNKLSVRGREIEEIPHATQIVGYEAASKIAALKIESVQNRCPPKGVIIAVQNFIVQIQKEKWYDLDLLVLRNSEKQLTLETYSQMTPVPDSVVSCVEADTPKEYKHIDTGFAVPICSLLASSLQVYPAEWQEVLTGVSRYERIQNAAKVLAHLYKNTLLPQNDL